MYTTDSLHGNDDFLHRAKKKWDHSRQYRFTHPAPKNLLPGRSIRRVAGQQWNLDLGERDSGRFYRSRAPRHRGFSYLRPKYSPKQIRPEPGWGYNLDDRGWLRGRTKRVCLRSQYPRKSGRETRKTGPTHAGFYRSGICDNLYAG